ncbi:MULTISPECIES: FAD-dependent monooxygenase [unclassified Paenibacillus]|uniref:FAD-dependent monooxygenase n=1 Tax=unclassified Paenibacillus TaxID=185978 RepID=UPI001AE7E736|nr:MULTISPECIES: FAD-dependent monooxygenase [unclassified Paenibacillus]MBP1154475.1 2-polyprenyl-6-methoxyphenol hydroxylase-like FAD-dependent oxidoreductase [Paenibacillus sp. PvP091]MBP1170141.1 2-polyprenyl-6-methoxyphenol hydroxylase-like FAD-dependent oxidoreductase [Paenibacillus sp. PvR098]MBP2441169.1 2-polyprenyl-6-methoxyphenol hydroxylase-like FAD-dependent oxidoreductase [Paenibacillus sp. PvP052]
MEKLTKDIKTDVCIVGAGPAGMLLGLLLAKQGMDILVLEQNADFYREYRGEITQPRFVQLMKQLNLLDYIETQSHVKIPEVVVFNQNTEIMRLAFNTLIEEESYCARLTQPTLLNALLEKSKKYPNFKLLFNTKVKDLLRDGEKIVGVYAQTKPGEETNETELFEGDLYITSKLTVGVDGRNSTMEKLGNFELDLDYYVNDLLWFSFKTPESWDYNIYHFHFQKHYNYLFLPKLDGYIQCGISLTRGEIQKIKEEGIEAFKKKIIEDIPILKTYLDPITDFKSFVLLLCKMRYVKDWAKDGCLLIGDAAHCVTPWGAVGSTLAMGTAVIAADVIYKGFKNNDLSIETLKQVQKRREKEVKMIQNLQVTLEKFLTREPVKKDLAPHMFSIATKMPDVQNIYKQLFTRDKPLEIDDSFIFSEEELKLNL